MGRIPKNLTGTATLTTTTGIGLPVLTFDGASQSIAGASAADWSWLNTSTIPMATAGIVLYSGSVTMSNWSGSNCGWYLNANLSVPAGAWVNLGTAIATGVSGPSYSFTKAICLFRQGISSKTVQTGGAVADYAAMYINGTRIGWKNGASLGNSIAATSPMTLGKNTNLSAFQAGGFLDAFIDDREWGEDEIQAYTNYWQWKLDQT